MEKGYRRFNGNWDYIVTLTNYSRVSQILEFGIPFRVFHTKPLKTLGGKGYAWGTFILSMLTAITPKSKLQRQRPQCPPCTLDMALAE